MKVAICTPHYGDVKAGFAQSLAVMIGRTARDQPEIELHPFFLRSSWLSRGRAKLLAEAIVWRADYVLWADSDHWFPDCALIRLLSHNLPIVGINSPTRSLPPKVTAYRETGDERLAVYTTAEKAEQNALEEVDSMGLGLALIHRSVVAEITPPFFKCVEEENMTEDFYFFRKARAAGFKIVVDHWLSRQCRHFAEAPLGTDDTLGDALH